MDLKQANRWAVRRVRKQQRRLVFSGKLLSESVLRKPLPRQNRKAPFRRLRLSGGCASSCTKTSPRQKRSSESSGQILSCAGSSAVQPIGSTLSPAKTSPHQSERTNPGILRPPASRLIP